MSAPPPNLTGAPNAGTWQAAVSENVRNNNLLQLCGTLFHNQTETQRATIIHSMRQYEKELFATAKSSQEYVTQLNGRVAAVAQRLQLMQAAQQQAPVANPAISMLQTPQFSIPAAAPPAAQPPQTNAQASLARVTDVIQNPENYSLQDILQALQVLQGQMHASNNKPMLENVIKRLFLEYQSRLQQQTQGQQPQQQAQAQVQAAMRQQQQQQQQQQAQAQAQVQAQAQAHQQQQQQQQQQAQAQLQQQQQQAQFQLQQRQQAQQQQQQPLPPQRVQLSDADKVHVRGNLLALERFMDVLTKLLPVIYIRTRDQGSIRKIYSIDVLVKEQRRLFDEDQYILSPVSMNSLYDVLHPFLATAKEWGLTQQQQGTPAGTDATLNRAQAPNAVAPGGQPTPTPLTNMHPGATTNDPELEGFQRAVKHPLDPDSLRLPPTKKRSKTNSSSSENGGLMTVGSASAMAATAGHPMQLAQHPMQQHVPNAFAPAPMLLPANITKEQFDRLPFETRSAILQSQQSALIRQNSMGVGLNGQIAPAVQQQLVGGAQTTNPLLLAAVQGISAHSAQSAEEQRLRVLEQDKWNNPLEYLMCVLGKFTKGAERAGVEPSPILQQAFWPIAKKSMSSGWGVVAADAVL
ncbi:hypothetical protein IWW39_005929 [Coemansia spiralis]|uniref:Mediator complex subunit 15 KIX domain-containing protein n=1 Tax=Coemansia spiralis TaxID=417178 RepID=A0A9W8L279_9FUNG|nr:hypothetical protein IWW39_005929 [Coemansia spiralis]